MLRFHALVAALSVCLFLNNAAFAQFVPPDLNPGDMYHLVFVTEGTADALVGKEINEVTLADYDAFVQAEAAINPALTGTDQGIQYRAIVTAWEEPHGEETTARDHTAVQAAVYRFDGERVADGEEDMWDGRIQLHRYQ